jgi:hypothetical protein
LSDIATALQAPIQYEGIEFPVLTASDVAAICGKIKAARADEAKKLAQELRLSPVDSFRAIQDIQSKGASLSDFISFTETPEGADEVLVSSLAKRGLSRTQAFDAIAKLDAFKRHEAAKLASTLFVMKVKDAA